MDEYRGRYQGYERREEHHHEEPTAHYAEPEPAPAPRGILPGLGIGGDFLDEYLPILLIILGALGIYLMLGKNGGGIGGLLSGFLK